METVLTTRAAIPDDFASIDQHRSRLSWAAIFGGLAATIALQVVFMMLGAGLGFALFHPLTGAAPAEGLGTGAVVIEGISAVVSLWFGGWVAGRFTPVASRAVGGLHGFLVWCAATVVGVLIVSAGVGLAAGSLSAIVGGGLSAAGKPAAAAVTGTTNTEGDAAKSSFDILGSFVDEAMAEQSPNATRGGSVRARRDIRLGVARLFNPLQQDKMAENRAALVQILVDEAGLKQPIAERIVVEWTDSYNRMRADLDAAKAQAEAKARDAAAKAAKVLTVLSLCSFFAFVLGGISAGCGGHLGAKSAVKHDEIMSG